MPIAESLLSQIEQNDPDLTYLDLHGQKLIEDDLIVLVKKLKLNTKVVKLNISENLIKNIGVNLLADPSLNFTSLDVSACGISDASSLASNPRITELTLSSNEVNALSIAKLAESYTLKSLALAGNNLKDEDVIPLGKNTSLSKLILSHNKIGIKGTEALAQSISITILDLNNNYIQTEGAILLAYNKRIIILHVAGNHIGLEGIVALGRQNQTLKSLNVSNNKVNDVGAEALAAHPSLIELNLSHNEITFKGAHYISLNTVLRVLYICYNLLEDAGTIFLAQHKTLERLDVSGNGVKFASTFILSKNKTLKWLALNSNELEDAAGVVLADNNCLEELYLSCNLLEDGTAKAFQKNTTLKTLNLNYNWIGEQGKKDLSSNQNITSLIISSEQPPKFTGQNLSTIFYLSESFICICDEKGIIQFFSPSFSKVLGYTQDELFAKSFFDFIHYEDKEYFEQQLHDQKKNIISYELRVRCKDKTFRKISWNAHLIHGRLYTVGIDVTEQRNMEKALIDIQKEALLNRILEAEAYNLRQTEFISHLSHEIRNPLAGIYGLIDSLKEQIKFVENLLLELQGVTSPLLQNKLSLSFKEIAESFTEMIICVEYQKTILNDNLDLMKITDGKLVLKNISFKIKKLMQEVSVIFKAKAHEKNLTFQTDYPEGDIWIQGDDLRLKQIVVNLIGNAVKFTEQGGVFISFQLANQTDEHLQLTIKVRDTGIGVSKKEIGDLFKRFTQASSAIGAKYEGSGLGLCIAKELANAMGGDITVISKKGKGSEFTVILPFAVLSPSKMMERNEEEKKEEQPKITTPYKKCRILIVDDNLVNQKILVNMLKKEGHECLVANDGVEALMAFNKTVFERSLAFNIIFMDVIMPKMDGLTATREIRKKERENNLVRMPIFAITANALEHDRQKGAKFGIDFYITKPFIKAEILEKLAIYTKVEPIREPALQYNEMAGLLFTPYKNSQSEPKHSNPALPRRFSVYGPS